MICSFNTQYPIYISVFDSSRNCFDVTRSFPHRVSLIGRSLFVFRFDLRPLFSTFNRHGLFALLLCYSRSNYGIVSVETRQVGGKHGLPTPVSQEAHPCDSRTKRSESSSTTTVQSPPSNSNRATTSTATGPGPASKLSGTGIPFKREGVP